MGLGVRKLHSYVFTIYLKNEVEGQENYYLLYLYLFIKTKKENFLILGVTYYKG